MVHSYNSRILRSRGRRIRGSRTAWATRDTAHNSNKKDFKIPKTYKNYFLWWMSFKRQVLQRDSGKTWAPARLDQLKVSSRLRKRNPGEHK